MGHPGENLAIGGPPGRKAAEALARKAIDTGMRVVWYTLKSLIVTLDRAAVDSTTAKPLQTSPAATSS